MSLRVRRVHGSGHGVPLPSYQSERAAGLDLSADVDGELVLAPGQRRLVPTGLAIALPPGFEGQVRPRSGLALKHGVTVLNAPGTIDEDYRGEVSVLLVNHGQEPFVIQRGMRIAQLVIARYERVAVTLVTELEDTARGSGGYGSTGAGSTGAGSTGAGSTGAGSTGA